MRVLACLPLLAGCSQLLGLDNLHQNGAAADAAIPPTDDVLIDATDGPPIKISGTATVLLDLQTGQMPSAGTRIELVQVRDESLVTSTITDDAGQFSLTVPAGSDIMLRTVEQPPFVVVLPAAAPTADADFSFTMFTSQALVQLGTVCPNPVGVDASLGQVFVFVADASNTPQAGYVVTSEPPSQATCYPSAGNTTGTQGAAILFNVPPSIGQVAALDTTGPAARSRAWAIPARSQSFVRLEVPPHP